jgi:hypothetical protein
VRSRLRTALALALVASAAACSHTPTAPKVAAAPSAPAPPPTPLAVANYFQSCWQNLSARNYDVMLSADYQFDFAPWDSSWFGRPPWSRADEESCVVHLFQTGTTSQPPTTSITFNFLATPTDSADPRPGMNPKWHRLITILPSLRVYYPDNYFELTGLELLYVVRGDSAHIPAELSAAGVKPDSTGWWLERWTDATPETPFHAVPARAGAPPNNVQGTTWIPWGRLKALYH